MVQTGTSASFPSGRKTAGAEHREASTRTTAAEGLYCCEFTEFILSSLMAELSSRSSMSDQQVTSSTLS